MPIVFILVLVAQPLQAVPSTSRKVKMCRADDGVLSEGHVILEITKLLVKHWRT